jgi:glycosyltransferase involved in cell wall biosynthesis
MELSVVVPTLNGRERLAGCLDALASGVRERLPGTEVIVVNGPSVDGTTGMVRDREDVDVLVEVGDRNVNAARNAGLERARGEVVAFIDDALSVEDGWLDGLRSALSSGEDDGEDGETTGPGVVTGPTHRTLRGGMTTEEVERRTIAGRTVTYFNGGNAAFRRAALDDIDGFDEYLLTGGARDAAHRLAAADREVVWEPAMSVRGEFGADGGRAERDWHWRYRALAYRLAKNYGLRASWRVVRHALLEGAGALREVAAGDRTASGWLGGGRDVAAGGTIGLKDGLLARLRDRTPRRNPRGLSARSDRAVAVYDRR